MTFELVITFAKFKQTKKYNKTDFDSDLLYAVFFFLVLEIYVLYETFVHYLNLNLIIYFHNNSSIKVCKKINLVVLGIQFKLSRIVLTLCITNQIE